MKKSVKSSEENKMVEAERPKCEKQNQNGSDTKRNTRRTTRLAKSSRQDTEYCKNGTW